MARKRLFKICSMSKLHLLIYAKQRGAKCYPRVAGRVVKRTEAGGRTQLTNEQVFCCGRKLGRHRRAGGRRKRRSYDWRRAARARASYRRRRKR